MSAEQFVFPALSWCAAVTGVLIVSLLRAEG